MTKNKLQTISKNLTFSAMTFLVAFVSIASIATSAQSVNNTANLIIGQVDTGTAIELSVCIKTDDTTLHMGNASTWFKYTPSALTPNPTILERGVYNSGNYLPLKWNAVGGTTDTWTMPITYSGDGTVAGSTQISAIPELIGKVKLDKTGSGSTALTLVKNLYFSTEEGLTPMNQTVTYVTTDCRGATTTVSTAGTPTATTSNPITGALGSAATTIALTGGNMPNGTVATFLPAGATTPITGTIVNGNFVPNAGQTIPAGTLTGARTGVLSVTGATPATVNVPTNFGSGTTVTPPSTSNTNTTGTVIVVNTNQSNTSSATTQPQANIQPENKATTNNQANIQSENKPATTTTSNKVASADEEPKKVMTTTTSVSPISRTVTTGGFSVQIAIVSLIASIIALVGFKTVSKKKIKFN